MKTLIVAAALAVFTAAPALADSGRASSGAVSAPFVIGSAVAGSVVAIPLLAVGIAGEGLLEASVEAFSNAERSNRPLRVTERTIITRRSPAEAMKSEQHDEKEVLK